MKSRSGCSFKSIFFFIIYTVFSFVAFDFTSSTMIFCSQSLYTKSASYDTQRIVWPLCLKVSIKGNFTWHWRSEINHLFSMSLRSTNLSNSFLLSKVIHKYVFLMFPYFDLDCISIGLMISVCYFFKNFYALGIQPHLQLNIKYISFFWMFLPLFNILCLFLVLWVIRLYIKTF